MILHNNTFLNLALYLGLIALAGCSSQPELHWKQESGYRWAKLSQYDGRKAGFSKLNPANTGINIKNYLSDSLLINNRILLNGSGVAAGDVDGDGWVDLYFTRLNGPNKLYRNMGGMHFKDMTDSAGIAQKGYYSSGATFADVDGDNDLDLLVTSLNKNNVLYLNDGEGHFERSTNSGLDKSKGATSVALADIDGDGDLDLYIANYREKFVRSVFNFKDLTWANTVEKVGSRYKLKPQFKPYYTIIHSKNEGPTRREIGEKDELYLNNGKGRFNKVTDLNHHFLDSSGQAEGLKRYWGLTATFHDINGDGLPDLYVCNDFWTPDKIWINQGKGIFRELDPKGIRNFSYSSMSAAFSDINRDGSTDFFVTEMRSPLHQQHLRQSATDEPYIKGPGIFLNQRQNNKNSLYINRGDTTFAETAFYSGVAATGWSWGTKFMDVDLDGYEDLIVNTGNVLDLQDLDTQNSTKQEIIKSAFKKTDYLLDYPSLPLVNKVFHNNGDLTFSDTSTDWGFHEADISLGIATADLDNDGDLDLINSRLNKKAVIYKNKSTAPRIAIRLKGASPNTQSIGAKVELKGGAVPQSKEIVSGGDYESGSDPQVVFAANGPKDDYSLSITWPGGKQTQLTEIKANRIYQVEEPQGNSEKSFRTQKTTSAAPWFKDVSPRMSYSHHEDSFPDFKIQSLLPERLSQLGPGLGWIDYDNDGDDDLWITSGKGGRTGIFENTGNGQFNQISLPKISRKAAGDQTAIIGWKSGKSTNIMTGSSNFEQNTPKVRSAFHYKFASKHNIQQESIAGSISTTGPIAAADYDNDGDIDVLVGGWFKPWFYPVDATSRLFKNYNGHLKFDIANAKVLKNIGMVTSAVFSDLDNDGDQDLICSLEWGPVKILRNDKGHFHDMTDQMGMNKYFGWWKGVATGDFNNDGRMDIIATNMGLNSSYQRPGSKHPLRMYYGDFNNDQHLDIIESFYDTTLKDYVPRRRGYKFKSIPAIARHVASNRQFARSTVSDLLGSHAKRTPYKKVNTLQHMLFINEGNTFKARPLPREAQLSAAFYAGVADINNDGNEDLFLSQNFFALPNSTPRIDAGRGLWLTGDGEGHLEPVPGNKSGIKIYGEQRGAALSDFNEDGKVDLAVSQNGAPVKLYINEISKRGYRISLSGPEANRNGIGSSLRLIYEDGSKGPRREIQAGSGYWSQNSVTKVMGAAKEVAEIEVDWFNGRQQVVTIEPSQKNYIISYKDIK